VSFSTLARDNGFSKDVVELALDKVVDSATVLASNRGEALLERKKLAVWWDGQLSKAQHDSRVIALVG
jgi:hypothetical protein